MNRSRRCTGRALLRAVLADSSLEHDGTHTVSNGSELPVTLDLSAS